MEEVYEVQLAENNLTVNEAGSPFALLEHVFAKTNQQTQAADAYRQVTYLNDITYENTQVLMEYATNGSFGSTTTAYSFGMQRESFVETASGMGAGAAIGGMTCQSSGTYYYTGTGSVANVTGTATNVSYSYSTGGSMTAYAMNASATGASGSGITGTSTLTTNPTAYGTYGVYGYNGEYTHTGLGLQYLRARYLNVATGTFTSRDTYVGRMQDILSQNRYTYAENNPVGHSDPSGHAVTHGNKTTRGFNQQTTMSTAERARQATQNSVKNYAQTQRLKNMTTTERAISATQNSINSYIKEKRQSLYPNVSIPNVEVGRDDITVLQWTESISTKIEKAMCAAYDRCANAIQEAIDEGRIVKGIVYAIPGTQSDRLSPEQQLANAEYIYNYLSKHGWSLEAICGLLGNIDRESVYNPGVWEVQDVTSDGYGIVQWTGADEKFLSWLNNELGKKDSDDMVDLVNEMAVNSPKKLMNYQLTYLLYTCEPGGGEWLPTTDYYSPKEMEYADYIETVVGKDENPEIVVKELALVFHGTYERSADNEVMVEKRANSAYQWYKHFQGIEDITQHLE